MKIPENAQAEKATLSILSNSPECLSSLPYKSELFFNPANRIIFQAIECAALSCQPCDAVGLASRLEGDGNLATVGGTLGLDEILNTLPPLNGASGSQAKYYHQNLVKALVARETLQAVTESVTDLRRMQITPAAFAEKIASAAQGPEIPARDTLKVHLDNLIADLERTEPREAFPTGLTRLDLALDGGIHRGEFLVVAGETGGGKSVLLAQIALASLQGGKAVALLSLEMPATDVLRRMASNLAGCRIKSIRERPTSREMDALSASITQLYSMPLTIIDDISSLVSIEAEARRLMKLKKADVVIVDYLQLVENSGPETREACVAEVARKLKNLALWGQCAVLTASQLNEDGRLRESRAIGHHADLVVNISDGSLVVVKNRRGPRDVSIPVTLRGELGRFDERH